MKLESIIELIKYACTQQPNVGQFIKGDIYDLNTLKDISYSVMALTERQHVMREEFMHYQFYLFYVDRLTSEADNVECIHSHAIQVLNNVLNSMTAHYDGLYINETRKFNTFRQRFADECAGAYVEFEVEVPVSMCEDPVAEAMDYQKGFQDGYASGLTSSYPIGFHDGYESGFTDGMVSGESVYYQSGFTAGYQSGYTYGMEQGYSSGYTQGENVGYGSGYTNGYTFGYSSGYTDGESDGETVGYNSGYTKGYESGNTDGYQSGYTAGEIVGYTSGFTTGFTSGFTSGETAGYNSGYTVGYSSGYTSGYTDGVEVSFQSGYTSGYTDGIVVSYASGFTNGADYLSGYTQGKVDGIASGNTDGYADGFTSGHTDGIAMVPLTTVTTSITTNGLKTISVPEGYSGMTQLNVNVTAQPNLGMTEIYYAYSGTSSSGVSVNIDNGLDIVSNEQYSGKTWKITYRSPMKEFTFYDGNAWRAVSSITFGEGLECLQLYDPTSNVSNSTMKIINFPSTLKVIECNGIAGFKGLVSVDMSNTQIEVIGNRAFTECTALSSVTLSDTCKYLGQKAFASTKIAEIDLKNVVTLCKEVFYSCSSLKKVTFGKSIKCISQSTFYGCTNIENLTYLGTMEEWNSVTKDQWQGGIQRTNVVHCTDGDVSIW